MPPESEYKPLSTISGKPAKVETNEYLEMNKFGVSLDNKIGCI